ncbi:MAG: TIGR00730 family Rossman fold protein [Mobilicoccus sp.]|nr:TIGR00730 family Rossman fold protein [Mobilicoccus sp.]
MQTICVFGGSSPGADPRYVEAAAALGTEIASRGMRLVYGGASIGLMGAVADAALASGADVLGVMPEHLCQDEIAHRGLTELRVTASMHERKQVMAQEADAFIALPGGFGTVEEVIEILTWNQLGLIATPVGLVDTLGYYGRLVSFFGHAVSQGFVRAPHLGLYSIDPDPVALLEAMEHYEPTATPKWVDRA